MAFRIYTDKNMVVIINTKNWKVDVSSKNELWYEYVSTDVPIKYKVHQRSPERILISSSQYTEFQDENGNGFSSDVILQAYLNEVLGSNNQSIDSGFQIDAGGRLRVSQVTSQLDIKQINDNQPLFYDRETIGTATQVWSKGVGGVTMSVSANNDAAICQSKMFANYFSGKSQIGEITFSGFQLVSGVIKRAGYFSSNTVTPFNSNKDGLWFESDGTDYRFVIQKNGVDIENVAQSDWNINTLEDFDGSKFQIFVFQFLYLGGSSVRFGFFVSGDFVWCHEYKHAGIISSTFVESPNQAIRYEIRSTGGSGSLDQICAHVGSEGSIDDVGIHRHFSDGAVTAQTTGTEYALIGIRLKSAYRNIRVEMQDLSLLCTTNDNYKWKLLLNPTVAGTFSYSDVDNSSIQKAVGATANTVTSDSEDIIIAEGYGQADSAMEADIKSSLRIGTTIAGVSDEAVLTVIPYSNNLSIRSTLGIQEYV